MINWRTVKEYIHMEHLPIEKRISSCTLDKYKNVIIDNIDKKMIDIFNILVKKGYHGNYSNLKYYVKTRNLKISTLDKNIFVNRSNIIELLNHKGISDLRLNKVEEENIKLLLKKDKNLAKIIGISDEFSIVLFSRNPNQLDQWIKKAKSLNILELNTFVSSLESDIVASKNSILYGDISNGLIEGKNCKMKMLKRMMFGRCSITLLRAKLLQLG